MFSADDEKVLKDFIIDIVGYYFIPAVLPFATILSSTAIDQLADKLLELDLLTVRFIRYRSDEPHRTSILTLMRNGLIQTSFMKQPVTDALRTNKIISLQIDCSELSSNSKLTAIARGYA